MLSPVRLRAHLALLVVVLTGLLTALATNAVALPLYLGNVGNVQIGATAIRGTGFDLGLAVDPDSGETGGALPVGELAFESADIDDLRLEKEFDLSALLGPGGGGTWKLAISATGTTTASGLRLDAAGVCADSIGFGPGFAVNGAGAATADVTDDLSLGASTITLGAPGIEATYLTTTGITLDDIRIDVVRGGYAFAPCAAAAAGR